jgi:hypothetical protein
LTPQASDKRSANENGRRKQFSQGNSTPDQPGKSRNRKVLADDRQVSRAGFFDSAPEREAASRNREEREGETLNK